MNEKEVMYLLESMERECFEMVVLAHAERNDAEFDKWSLRYQTVCYQLWLMGHPVYRP